MKLLALDSSGLAASVAVLEDDVLVAEFTTQFKKTHSQTLVPMLEEVRKMIDLDLKTVDAIALAAGPGSFTGLRIGSATAKGLGMALQIPLVSVPTVEALAYNLYGTNKLVCPIMDARRNQVYTGIYQFHEAGTTMDMETVCEQCAISFEALAEKLNALGKEVIFLGDGVPVFAEQMKSLLEVPYFFAAPGQSCQKAASVAYLGAKLYKKGQYEEAFEHSPEYLRLSQAERERKEEQKELAEAQVVRKEVE